MTWGREWVRGAVRKAAGAHDDREVGAEVRTGSGATKADMMFVVILVVVLVLELAKQTTEIKVRDDCATQTRCGVMVVPDEAERLYAVDIDKRHGTISQTDSSFTLVRPSRSVPRLTSTCVEIDLRFLRKSVTCHLLQINQKSDICLHKDTVDWKHRPIVVQEIYLQL